MLKSESFFKDLANQFALLKGLQNYVVEIYVRDGNDYLSATILTTDNLQTKVEIPISDIVYLTEYGTITLPGKHLLENIIKWCSNEFDKVFDKIADGVLNEEWGENKINEVMLSFEAQANNHIQVYLSTYADKTNILAGYLGEEGISSYLTDMNVLKNYIRCKVYKKSR